ncbi:MAG: hypothetical protein V9G15_07105 [Dermatophilaceae bacterium]
MPQGDLAGVSGPVWLGIDAGSTTIKSVVLDAEGTIVFSTYGSNEGDPVAAAVNIAREVIGALPEGAFIGRSCVTGYGEELIKAALHADEGEIETMAHFRAAAEVMPRRHQRHRHRRSGHEVPEDPQRHRRLDLGQRGLLVGLRFVPADLRRDHGHRRARFRQGRAHLG